MAGNRLEYRFHIDAFKPETLPLARLAEYLADIAVILGEREHVHFVRVESGSTVPVVSVEWEAVPKVRQRVLSVKRRQAPAEVLRIADGLNRRLADDNASAVLINPHGANVFRFPGRDARECEPDFTFSQPGELFGVVIVVGGTSDPVPVHLDDEGRVQLCEAPRAIARGLAQLIFGSPVAVQGLGRWLREADGAWKMRSFRITSFRSLDNRPLTDIVTDLKKVPGGVAPESESAHHSQ